MATATIAVFDTKAAADAFAESLPAGTDLRKFGPLTAFAFDQTYGATEKPTVSNPSGGPFHIVVAKR